MDAKKQVRGPAFSLGKINSKDSEKALARGMISCYIVLACLLRHKNLCFVRKLKGKVFPRKSGLKPFFMRKNRADTVVEKDGCYANNY